MSPAPIPVPLLGDIPLLERAVPLDPGNAHQAQPDGVPAAHGYSRSRRPCRAFGEEYSDIRVIETDSASPTILPANPTQLFDGRGEPAPAIDLRQ